MTCISQHVSEQAKGLEQNNEQNNGNLIKPTFCQDYDEVLMV